MTDFLQPGAARELVQLTRAEWNFICKLIETKQDVEVVPLLLKGVLTRMPKTTEWVALKEKLREARTQVRATQQYSRRRTYMRQYMRLRRQQQARSDRQV